jgi:hypothetical protein
VWFDGQTSFEDIAGTIANSGSILITVAVISTGALLALDLYPASTDRISPGKATALPSWVPSETETTGVLGVTAGKGAAVEVGDRDRARCPEVGKCFYFAVVQSISPPNMGAGKRNRSVSTAGKSSAPASSQRSDTFDYSCNTMSASSMSSPHSGGLLTHGDFPPPRSLRGLVVGPLLGSGSFGKGTYTLNPRMKNFPFLP